MVWVLGKVEDVVVVVKFRGTLGIEQDAQKRELVTSRSLLEEVSLEYVGCASSERLHAKISLLPLGPFSKRGRKREALFTIYLFALVT